MSEKTLANFQYSTLVELLRHHAEVHPAQRAYTFLEDGETQESNFTYGELDRRARAIATLLQQSAAEGARVLLLYPPGPEYIAAFFGCLYAGMVAVPAYPPDPSRLNRTLPRLQAIVADAQAQIALTVTPILSMAEFVFAQAPDLRALHWIATDEIPEGSEAAWRTPQLDSQTLAFLQYTSGSTGTPKGVILTHGNLLHNERLIKHAFGHDEKTIVVGWLPLYHDMGLIGNMLQPLYVGTPCILMSPISFLQKPLRWLQAISRYHATTSGGPNFAYDLCVRKVTDEEKSQLDLSTWTLAYSGAEPVRSETLDRFFTAFEPCGFKRSSFYPCYGLAEATLIVSGGKKGVLPIIDRIDGLAQGKAVATSEGGHLLVSAGRTLLEQRLAIVQPDRRVQCAPGEVGEIWVKGGSVAQGYWNRPEATVETFQARLADDNDGPFLRTGDLGFVRDDGELFITGRWKDLIIIRGRNHYPQDIELTVERSHPALRPGCGAAISIDVAGEERVVIIQEVDRRYKERRVKALPVTEGEVRSADRRQTEVEPGFDPNNEGTVNLDEVVVGIRQAIAEQHELQLHAVLLLKPGGIPKTSSGKIQRHACQGGFLAGTLEVVCAWHEAKGTETTVAPAKASVRGRRDFQTAQAIESWLVERIAGRAGVPAKSLDIHQPITRYGLDSLAAVELQNEMEVELRISLPMVLFLQGLSVSQLAARALSQSTLPTKSGATLKRAEKTATEYPLSRGQEALWFLHQLAPESVAYNVASAVRISSELDVWALRRAFQRLVDRHPALRTTFSAVDGKPFQKIGAKVEAAFEVIDSFSHASEAELQAELMRRVHLPFDLQNGPLMRVSVFVRDGKHVLLLVLHHIITDFWSLSVLAEELGPLYQFESGGSPISFPEFPVEYSDYVQWQTKWLAGAEAEQQWQYWQKQLNGAPAAIELPTDRPRPPIQTYHGAVKSFRIDPALTRRLKALGDSAGATLNMTLLAAYQVLLHRYTGQSDLVVGSPTAGRNHAQLAGTMGYFINPVALRADFSEALSFQGILEQVRQSVLEALEHQTYPFVLLVERLRPTRDPSRSPMFQTMFVLQRPPNLAMQGLSSLALGNPGVQFDLHGLAIESMAQLKHVAQFDLTMMVAEIDDGLGLSLHYNTDLFDGNTIERLGVHYAQVLEAMVHAPATPVADISLLTESERDQLLVRWNQTNKNFAGATCLHQLFEAQAARTPERKALVNHDGKSFTYREFDERANQVAHYLSTIGVSKGSLVALCLDRGIEMVEWIVGVLKAGAGYVPIDPTYPAERRTLIVNDAKAVVIVTAQTFASGFAGTKPVVCVDEVEQEVRSQSRIALPHVADEKSFAYVIYTSGSTGTPKGVAITHAAISNYVNWICAEFPLGEQDAVMQNTSVAFDVSIREIFWTLSSGAKLVLPKPGGQQDLDYLVREVERHGVTNIRFVPSMLAVFIEHHAARLYGKLKRVFSGGEAMPAELPERFYSVSDAELVNTYGPTETAVNASFWRCPRGDERRVVPIGRPIANVKLYIVDRNLNPVPIGVAGELLVGGAAIMGAEYLGSPELTAQKFIPNPFDSDGRVYRTGDLARFLPDGNVEFMGRIDRQVKIRGFRIELGEIEAALERHTGITQAVVEAKDAGTGNNRLVGYAVTKGTPPTPTELQTHLKTTLPDYMVPTMWVFLDALPLTPNGKIDRKALPTPDVQKEVYEEPRSEIERQVAEIWAKVLGVERVGSRDNFFDLGGNSLIAVQVASRLRTLLGSEVPLRTLFDAPTVAELAERAQPSRQILAPIPRVPRAGALPLSFAQERMWLLEQLDPGRSDYNMPAAIRLSGVVDQAALEQSFRKLIERHDSLRSAFRGDDGQSECHVSKQVEFAIAKRDLSTLDEESRSTELERIITEEARRPFDLARAPLLRVNLLTMAPTDHVMVIVMHHIISDGWSTAVITREVAALYEAEQGGKPVSLPALEIQYADYAAWERQQLAGQSLQTLLSYWKEQLRGAPPILELSSDRPRPAVFTARGARRQHVLPKPLIESLERLTKAESGTLYMTLLAAFQTLLSRYTGQTDIVVGSPVANRAHPQTESILGMFVNTIALRSDLSDNPTFRELLKRVRTTTLGAFEHQGLPFEKLVEAINPPRDLSRTPIFQVIFVLQNAPAAALTLSGLKLVPLEIDPQTSQFDLTFSVTPRVDHASLTVEYDTDLFDVSTIDHLAEHFVTLLAEIVADPDRRVSELPILSEAQRNHVLALSRETATSAIEPRQLVHRLIEKRASRSPNNVAVVSADAASSLSYSELNRRANGLAHKLLESGHGPGARVALFIDRTVDFAVGLLGILKAGCAYVPVDPNYPAERIALLLSDSAPGAIVTTRRQKMGSATSALPILYADEVITAELAPDVSATLDDAAYVIYTSGSTGRPKGVVVSHRSLANHNLDFIRRTELSEKDRVLQFASPSFDAAAEEIFPTWIAGGTLVLRSDDVPSTDELAELVQRHRVSLLDLPTAYWHQLVADLVPTGKSLGDSLRLIVLGGEKVSSAAVASWQHLFGSTIRCLNTYGPTEATVVALTYEVVGDWDSSREVPIGRPIANVFAYVLDLQRNPVPIGVPGELYLGGEGVAVGYLAQPELTRERFFEDPFHSGGRMYRTGDRVRFLDDGNLEYLGRFDNQVKIRGFRIELGEIEYALETDEEVGQAIVMAREDMPGEKRLVAYVVPAKLSEMSIEQLKKRIGKTLPEYMVPTAFVVMAEFPLSPNGKVDRGALPSPVWSASRERYVAPRTTTETQVAQVWADVLGARQVGVDDNFFDLGGNSLNAVRVVSRLRMLFGGSQLSLRTLFEAPTVALLANRIHPSQGRALAPIASVSRDATLPLSYAQTRMWILDQLDRGRADYHIAAAVRLSGALDVTLLEQSIRQLVERHESLRVGFHEVAGGPESRLFSHIDFAIEQADLASLDESAREIALAALAQEESLQPFNLAKPPLLRVKVVRTAALEHVMLITLHHIISDGWSIAVMTREIGALYDAARGGKSVPLIPLEIQYADYAAWERNHLTGETLDSLVGYWKKQLGGAPPTLELPSDRSRPSTRSGRGARLRHALPKTLFDSLEQFSRKENTTLFMTLLGAFQTLLYRYTGQTDIVVGSPVANREHSQLESLIGIFVNTLALRTDLSGNPEFREVLHRVREVTLGAFEHQQLPFERLVEALNPPRDLSHTPVFQIMFVLQNAPAQALKLHGLELSPVEFDLKTSQFDLTLSIEVESDAVQVGLAYDTELFDASTVERLFQHFATLLLAIVTTPDQRIDQLPMLSTKERHHLLVELNQTARSYPATQCIHEIFEEQVRRTPTAIAVSFEGERLTYQELNQRANQLAHYLKKHGVGTDVLVGVCVERSLEMVIALYGVLKAGGAYVPLDPGYPKDRLAFMMEDARTQVLLTQGKLVASLPSNDAHLVRLDDDWSEIARESRENPKRDVSDENLAYMIYTSGSTGKPKGAMNTHGGIRNRLQWMQEAFGLTEADVVLQKTPFSFDVSVWEFFWPLLYGARLEVAKPGGHQDPDYLVNVIESAGVTTAHFVPSMLQVFVNVPGLERCGRLKLVMCSGEALSYELTERFRERLPRTELHNLYGPTEAAVDVTWWRCEQNDRKVVPIGKPIANTKMHVLSPTLEPVPIGVAGELFIGGVQLARGYLNRPELTAEKFIPDPFGKPGERLYRTGDLARYWSNGIIEYLGRIDHQVKIRGFRIELGEIEATLESYSGVKQAVVVAREDTPGDKRLVAYVAAQNPSELAVEELKRHLGKTLPEHMVPAAFVVLEELPLSPNGKVDRKLLPRPDWAAAAERYVAPSTAIEAQIAQIWSQILKIPRVGIDDNFFALGGNSLLALQVISRIRTSTNREFSLRSFFEGPTVRGMATALERGQAPSSVIPSLEPRPRTSPYAALSIYQERLWRGFRLNEDSPAFHVSAVFRLKGVIRLEAFGHAVDQIVARHEMLRTTFVVVDGQPRQKIAPSLKIPVSTIDVSGDGGAEKRALTEVDRLLQQSFDLEKGPLLRLSFIRLSAEEHIGVLAMHHIITDGWSRDLFFKELVTLYAAECANRPAELAPLSIQYGDYAEWQRSWLTGALKETQISYWKRHLLDCPAELKLPFDRPRPRVENLQGRKQSLQVRGALYERIIALGNSNQSSLFMTLLAAFKILLCEETGQRDIVVGVPIAIRNRVELENLIGYFVNHLALRTKIDKHWTFRQLLAAVRGVTMGAYQHQDISILDSLGGDYKMPLYQVRFNMLNLPERNTKKIAGVEIQPISTDEDHTLFDMAFYVSETDAGFEVVCRYKTELFDASTIAKILTRYEALLQLVISSPDVELEKLSDRL